MQIKIVSPTDKNFDDDFQLTNTNPLDVAILPAPGMMNMLKWMRLNMDSIPRNRPRF